MEHGSIPLPRRRLEDIDKKFTSQSGLHDTSELETPRGSIRIQHLTGGIFQPPADGGQDARSRFPKLEECAHFHYDHVELAPFTVEVYYDASRLQALPPVPPDDISVEKFWIIQVTSNKKTWHVRRGYENFCNLDKQLHKCIYDRNFSCLPELSKDLEHSPEDLLRPLLTEYLNRLSQINGPLVNCAPVLNWFELDNRGHRLIATDDSDINTPAVAAAYAIRRYHAQAADEISFEVGDMISVIDMPPPEESAWWRGKRGFDVGFFPFECVQVIGEKVPTGLQFPPPAPLSGCPTAVRRNSSQLPNKPVLRKHGKLISFFRSFILSRPARRKLKQSGILKERVFGCDLGEHLLNSGHDIPLVLRVCADYIESHGIVDGIYRLSGVSSNIQKLRIAFDEDRSPLFQNDEQISQDIHAVSSLLKMYFRELPNPLCTYQLYAQFVGAVQQEEDESRLMRMREVVQQLPPPHYRTLEYLMRHLSHVAENGSFTGMTAKNLAIVWAPNLLRCKELEAGGVAALQGVGIQAVVTEYLVRYVNLIFSTQPPTQAEIISGTDSRRLRPKSLAIATPGKLLSLEEARNRAQLTSKTDQKFIEVGGGPSTLPKYHTVIELPNKRGSSIKHKKSPSGWKAFFSSKSRGSSSSGTREEDDSPKGHLRTMSSVSAGPTVHLSRKDQAGNQLSRQGSIPRRKLRPVKSAESLVSGSNSSRNSQCIDTPPVISPLAGDLLVATPILNNPESPLIDNPRTHNRSASHDSYFNVLVGPVEVVHEPVDESFVLSDMQLDSTLNLDNSDMNMMCSEEMMPDKSQDDLCVASDPKRSKVDTEVVSAHLTCAVNRIVSRSELQCAFNPVYDISDKKSGHSTPENTDAQVGDIVSETIDRSDSLENVSIQENTELPDTGLTTSECSISLPAATLSDNQSLTINSRPQIAVNIDYENMLSSVDINVPYESIQESAPPSYTAVVQDELYENVLYSTQEMFENSGYEPFEQEKNTYEKLLEPENAYEKLEATYESLVPEEVCYEVLQQEEAYEIVGVESDKQTESQQTYENVEKPHQESDTLSELSYDNCNPEPAPEISYENYESEPAPEISYENYKSELAPEISYENYKSEPAPEISYENYKSEPALEISYENYKPEPAPRTSVCLNSASYENVGDEHDAPVDEEITYENILKQSELKAIISAATESNLYEDVSVGDLTLMPTPPSSLLSEEAVYQQVKVLKRSIEEVNEIIREPVAERLSPTKTLETPTVKPQKEFATSETQTPTGSEELSLSPVRAATEPASPAAVPPSQLPARAMSASLDCPVPWRAKKSKTDGSPKPLPVLAGSETSEKNLPPPVIERPKKLEIQKMQPMVPPPILARTLIHDTSEAKTESSKPSPSEKPKPSELPPKRPTVLGFKPTIESKPPVLLRSTTSLEKLQARKSSTADSPTVATARSSLSLALESPSIESRIRSKTDSDPSLQSPTRRLSFLETGESKRRVESEIGRDLIHARKLRDEMEIRRNETVTPPCELKENINPKIDPRKVDGIVSARPALVTPVNNRFERKPDKKASVKDLLNRFEIKDDSDQKTKSLEGISTLQEVLIAEKIITEDEPVRPKSAPGDDESRLLVNTNEPLSLTELNDRLSIDPKVLVDINDPVTRQRIEKYKEERRSQLREKYKSESFRGEKDEMLMRLKQKAGSPTRIEDASPLDRQLESPKINRINRRNSSKSDLSPSPDIIEPKLDLVISTKIVAAPMPNSESIGDDVNVKELVANWTKGNEGKPKKEEEKKVWKKEEKKVTPSVVTPTPKLVAVREVAKENDKGRIKNMAAIFEKETLATTSK